MSTLSLARGESRRCVCFIHCHTHATETGQWNYQLRWKFHKQSLTIVPGSAVDRVKVKKKTRQSLKALGFMGGGARPDSL